MTSTDSRYSPATDPRLHPGTALPTPSPVFPRVELAADE